MKELKPYDKYKDSGIEWFGSVPEHWKITKIGRTFFNIGSGTTPKTSNEQYYENGTINWLNTGDLNDGIVCKTSRKVTEIALKEVSSLKMFSVGSVVIAMYGATIGKLGFLTIDTTTNQACCVISGSKNILQMYLFYFMYACKENIISMSYGGGQPNISQEVIKALYILQPPISEQQKIASYLDYITNQIDVLVKEKESLIERLGEQRAAIINEAITRGLNPNAPMKDSGIEWLGKVPEHWKIILPKYVLLLNKGRNPKKLVEMSELDPYLTMNYLRGRDNKMVLFPETDENLIHVEEGDILILCDGANAGEIIKSKKGYLSSTMATILIRNEKLLFACYLYFFLKAFERFFKDFSSGTTIPHFDGEVLLERYYALPPLNEQQEIVDYISKKVERIDAITKDLKIQIDKLKEYRQSVISESITGKVDLRGWQVE